MAGRISVLQHHDERRLSASHIKLCAIVFRGICETDERVISCGNRRDTQSVSPLCAINTGVPPAVDSSTNSINCWPTTLQTDSCHQRRNTNRCSSQDNEVSRVMRQPDADCSRSAAGCHRQHAPTAYLKSEIAGSWTMSVVMPCTFCAASGICMGAMFTSNDMVLPLSCSIAASSTILFPFVGGPAACTSWMISGICACTSAHLQVDRVPV